MRLIHIVSTRSQVWLLSDEGIDEIDINELTLLDCFRLDTAFLPSFPNPDK